MCTSPRVIPAQILLITEHSFFPTNKYFPFFKFLQFLFILLISLPDIIFTWTRFRIIFFLTVMVDLVNKTHFFELLFFLSSELLFGLFLFNMECFVLWTRPINRMLFMMEIHKRSSFGDIFGRIFLAFEFLDISVEFLRCII